MLQQRFGKCVDKSKCFVDDKREIKLPLPKKISTLDIVDMKHQMKQMKEENSALQEDRIYRVKCSQLKERCRKLENEKEGVRCFWRN